MELEPGTYIMVEYAEDQNAPSKPNARLIEVSEKTTLNQFAKQ